MIDMWQFMLIAILSFNNVSSDLIASASGQDDLLEMLHTEKVLIDSLRHYIETQERSLNALKGNIQKVQNIHDSVGANREKYISNPINSVTILKRFTSDWRDWKKDAEDYLNTEELINNIKKQQQDLTFPTEDEYDTALGNLLRIQDMFKLESQHLSVGEVSGVKLGSEMSWSDCLEIGLKSFKKGYQTYAKYWMETALEKIPNVLPINNSSTELTAKEGKTTSTSASARDDYTVKARLEVLRALLNVEYNTGNLDRALKITTEMLAIKPKQKNVHKAIEQIKDAKKKKKKNNQNGNDKTKNDERKTSNKKTDEELMIEEICRGATNNQQIHSVAMTSHRHPPAPPPCTLQTNNLKWLMLQPLQVELLSLDPFIVIYHNVLSDTQLSELKEFLMENENSVDDDNDAAESMQLTKIGLKKMRQINEKLHYVTGHGRDALDNNRWQVKRYNFENLMEVETTAPKDIEAGKRQARVLFNMQQSLLGGSVIFPQLELSINLPKGAILHWSTLNEFNEADYRSNYHICPVIGGIQLTATTYVRSV